MASENNFVGVIGAGMMGHGIAVSFARAGYDVILIDKTEDIVNKGMAWIKSDLRQLVDNQLLSSKTAETIISKIKGGTDLAKAAGNPKFVMEAVFENLELKREVFKRLDEICPEETIIASNTSSFKVTDIASATKNKSRVVGAHWINPPHIMPLVEVVPGEKTSKQTLDTVVELFRKIGKVPVVCQDVPGFINNRLLFAMLNEGLNLIDMGAATPEDVDNTIRFGFGIRTLLYGPFKWCDFFNEPKIILSIYEYLYKSTNDPKFKPSKSLRELVDSGNVGFATGKGWYDYPEAAANELDSNRLRMLMEITGWFKKKNLW